MPVAEALRKLQAVRHRVKAVADEAGKPAGLVPRADALRWTVEAIGDSTDSDRETMGERVSDPSVPQVHLVTH